MGNLRVAIIGCGAVAELVHLRSLVSIPGTEASLLVDNNPQRASQLAAAFNIPATSTDYRDAIGRADAAIIAVPHHLPAPVAVGLLSAGLHVLVEKPMALSTRDCDGMIAAADAAGRVLSVGLLRRFHDSLRFAKNTRSTVVCWDGSRAYPSAKERCTAGT